MKTAFAQLKNQDAFNKKEGICYVPESGNEAYTYQGILAIAKNNHRLAEIIFNLCEWQHPETIFDELLREGEIDENGNILEQKK